MFINKAINGNICYTVPASNKNLGFKIWDNKDSISMSLFYKRHRSMTYVISNKGDRINLYKLNSKTGVPIRNITNNPVQLHYFIFRACNNMQDRPKNIGINLGIINIIYKKFLEWGYDVPKPKLDYAHIVSDQISPIVLTAAYKLYNRGNYIPHILNKSFRKARSPKDLYYKLFLRSYSPNPIINIYSQKIYYLRELAQTYFLSKILPYDYIDSVLIDFSYNFFIVKDLTVKECNLLKKILLKLSEPQRKLMFTKASLKVMGLTSHFKSLANLSHTLRKYEYIKDVELDFKGKTFNDLMDTIQHDIKTINQYQY